jgi:hypothetical protein
MLIGREKGYVIWTVENITETSVYVTFTIKIKRCKVKGKGKGHPTTGHEGPEGIDGVGDERHAPAVLPPGNNRYQLYRRMGGRTRKISPPPPGFDPRTVQPVASRYTDLAILVHKLYIYETNIPHVSASMPIHAHPHGGGYQSKDQLWLVVLEMCRYTPKIHVSNKLQFNIFAGG